MNKLNKILWGIISCCISVVYNTSTRAHDCILDTIDNIYIDCNSSDLDYKCPDEQLTNSRYKNKAFEVIFDAITNSGYYNYDDDYDIPIYWLAGSEHIDDILNIFNNEYSGWVSDRTSLAAYINSHLVSNSTYNGNTSYGSYCYADAGQSCSNKITNCPSHTSDVLAQYTTMVYVDQDVIEYRLADYNLRTNPRKYNNTTNRLYIFNNTSSAIEIMSIKNINDCKYFYSYEGKKNTVCKLSTTKEYKGSDEQGQYTIPKGDVCYYE